MGRCRDVISRFFYNKEARILYIIDFRVDQLISLSFIANWLLRQINHLYRIERKLRDSRSCPQLRTVVVDLIRMPICTTSSPGCPPPSTGK
jgi:hypothetical protein